jgi:hypothetical protein
LDELFVNIHGRQQYLWRAVDQDGDVTDIRMGGTLATAVCSTVTLGHSACRRTGNGANSGDFEAEGWRMAAVLKDSAPEMA